MPVDQNGVTVGSGTNAISISWDQFNAMAPDAQTKVLVNAGVDQSKVEPLLHALQGTEIEQYKQYQADQAHKKTMSSGASGFMSHVPLLGRATHEVAQTAADLSGGALGGQGMERVDDKSLAQMQKQSGFADILNQVSSDTAAKAIEKAVPAGQVAPGTTVPAYSDQALNAYVNNYVMPVQKEFQGLIQGDMHQWENAVGNIATATGTQHSPIMQLLESQAQGDTARMKIFADTQAQAALTPAYTAMINNAYGAAANIGARQAAQGYAAANLNQYAQIDPTTGALIQSTAGLGGLGGAGTIANLFSGIGGATAATPTTTKTP